MIPSEKAKEIWKFVDGCSLAVYGRKTSTCIKNDICVSCGKDANSFKDELSKKEFSMSGLCQNCQKTVF